MSLMGNHGYDETTDAGELLDAQSDAEHFARTVEQAILPTEGFATWAASLSDEQRDRVTPAERAERLMLAARQQHARERGLARRAGWL
ncbi:hypothetical protein ABZ897_00655 [Nonomuraea sp. NPDC046802]|uniref:hypothetical protein n=1 Tax=Nonomuraea sp. NPDC046802 TaxID=3154919 RepID=UPI0033EAB4B2